VARSKIEDIFFVSPISGFAEISDNNKSTKVAIVADGMLLEHNFATKKSHIILKRIKLKN